MYKSTIIVFFLLLLPISGSAQTSIEVELPSSSQYYYVFSLSQGAKSDTLQTGRLNEQGKASIVIPQSYENYKGVAKLWLQEINKTYNIVINKEETIKIIEQEEESEEIQFENSPENSFILETTARQTQLIQEYIHAPTLTAMGVERQYQALQKEISESPLYAARLIEILNCLTGTGNSFTTTEQEILANQKRFILEQLDLEDLYTSSFWELTLSFWFELNMTDDDQLLIQSRQLLDKTANNLSIKRELIQTFIKLFSKYGKESLLPQIAPDDFHIPVFGDKAPAIQSNSGSFFPSKSLIIFYETDCGSCDRELDELKKKYTLLTDNKVRVISIAADIDRDIYNETAEDLPWSDKYCDFKGFDGENFLNYGIVGTPTLILIDDEGIIRGRYAQVKEWLK